MIALQFMVAEVDEADVPLVVVLLPVLLPLRLVKTDACAIFLVPGDSPVESEWCYRN